MNKNIIFSVVLFSLLLIVSVGVAFAQNNPNTRWEYTYTSDYSELSRLGTQGWELVLEDRDRDYILKRNNSNIRWEYTYTSDYSELSRLGTQGWELVLEDRDSDYILKRRLQ